MSVLLFNIFQNNGGPLDKITIKIEITEPGMSATGALMSGLGACYYSETGSVEYTDCSTSYCSK